jgi:hypothetical protein
VPPPQPEAVEVPDSEPEPVIAQERVTASPRRPASNVPPPVPDDKPFAAPVAATPKADPTFAGTVEGA